MNVSFVQQSTRNEFSKLVPAQVNNIPNRYTHSLTHSLTHLRAHTHALTHPDTSSLLSVAARVVTVLCCLALMAVLKSGIAFAFSIGDDGEGEV